MQLTVTERALILNMRAAAAAPAPRNSFMEFLATKPQAVALDITQYPRTGATRAVLTGAGRIYWYAVDVTTGRSTQLGEPLTLDREDADAVRASVLAAKPLAAKQQGARRRRPAK
jgi:hypothetical protein